MVPVLCRWAENGPPLATDFRYSMDGALTPLTAPHVVAPRPRCRIFHSPASLTSRTPSFSITSNFAIMMPLECLTANKT
jgi:hypothetical protein